MKKEEEYYKNVILIFAGVQVMIAVLQLIQSIVDSEFTTGKLISLTGLVFIVIFLWYVDKKI